MEKLVNNLVAQINKKTDARPTLAIILGSGLGNFANNLKNRTEIEYKDLKGMPISTVEGHSGKFIFGQFEGVSVVIMQGRLHLYEGYSAK